MIKSLIITSIIYSNYVFAENLNSVANEFIINYILEPSQKFSRMNCLNSICSVDVIKNEISEINFIFKETKNNYNNAVKTEIITHNILKHDIKLSSIVCINNSECKYFTFDQLDKSEYAYVNGVFKL